MELKTLFIQDAEGNILPGASCFLYQVGTSSLVTEIYDRAGAPLSNPFPSDIDGMVQFATLNGRYDLRCVAGERDRRIEVQFMDSVTVLGRLLAPRATAPTMRDTKEPLQEGDQYPNTVDHLVYNWNGSTWIALNESVVGLTAALAAPPGSGMVGHIFGSEHSEATTLQAKARAEMRSFLDFIPDNQKAAFKAGTSTWDASERANYAIRELGGGGILLPKGSCMALGTPLDILRGTIIRGDGSFDTTPGVGTKIMLLPGANCEIIRTPNAWESSPATHFMGIENLLLDGNKANQTVEVLGGVVKFWGAWVGSWLDKVCILNTFGTSLDFRGGSDVAVDHLWIVGCTSTNGYALDTNADLTGSVLNGLMQFSNLYVENTGIDKTRSPKTEEIYRGKNVRLRRLVSCHITDLHTEGAAIGVDLAQNHIVRIDKITCTNIGSSVFPESALVRHVESPTRSVSIGPLYLPAGFPGNPYIVRKAAALASNNSIPEVGPLSNPWVPGYVSQSDMLFAYAKQSKTAFTNTLAVERVGSFSEQSINIFGGDADTVGVRKTYIKEAGGGPRIGTSANKTDNLDKDFITITSTAGTGAGDRVTFSDPILVGRRADSSSVPAGAIYQLATGPAMYVQRVTGQNTGRDAIVTMIIGSGVPTQNADFLGQEYQDNTAAKRVYKAVNVGTGASDWKPITA